MMTGEFKPVRVYSRARPRRIAYLLDPTNADPELLDRLFDFNYGLWGGRFNPIIPVVSGSISPSYWHLLQFVDPDIVYSYTALPLDLIRKIDRELSPLEIKQHPKHFFEMRPPSLSPGFLRDQVDVYAAWPQTLHQDQWLRRRSRFLTSPSPWEWPAGRFVLRNFGSVPENLARKPYSETDELLCLKQDWSEERILEEVAHARFVTFPFQGSSTESFFPEAQEQHDHAYCVVLGDDPESWLFFWNRVLLLSDYRRRYWHSICISVERLERPEYRDALGKFLNAFVYHSGSPSPVDVVSFHHTEDQLKEICQNTFVKLGGWFRPKRMEPNEFPPITVGHAPFPEFSWPGVNLGPDRTTRQQATSAKSILKTPDASVSLERGCWIMELRIEYWPQFPFYSNESIWWQLPRRREIGRLFVNEAARVDRSQSLSVEISGRNVFELRIPSDSDAILAVLGAGRRFELDENLEHKMVKPAYERIISSDKGDYANGVLRLFEGLQSAGHFFESSFWRSLFERLSRRGKEAEAERLEAIRNKLNKRRHLIERQLSSVGNEPIDWLSRYILNLARQEHMNDEETTFEDVSSCFHQQREAFIVKHPDSKGTTPEEISADRLETTKFLRRTFQGLVDSGIFLQGVSVRCSTCGSRYWVEIAQAQQRSACRGCGATINLQVESTWRYRLNTLVRNAVAFHGTIPVILTLYQLRQYPTRYFFLFAPGLSLFESYGDRRPRAEVDVVCVADGKLIVGEVKQSSEEFTDVELAKLVKVSENLGASCVALGCLTDEGNRLAKKEQQLRGLLSANVTTMAIRAPAYAFEPSPHP